MPRAIMNKHLVHTAAALIGLLAPLAAAQPALAQQGFALKGAAVFNQSQAATGSAEQLPDVSGFSVGAEMVLPLGVGVGVTGYTAGGVRDFDLGTGSLVVLGEANYFLRLPMLPVAPYAGVHVGLGRYRLDDVRDAPRPDVDFGDLGYQLGVRLQATRLLGIDAQYRRVSGSLRGMQDSRFETDQLLIGATLF